MKELVECGRTVEEAVDSALEKLHTSKENIDFEVLEEGSKGFFGLLGSKMAKVKVWIKNDPKKMIVDFVSEMLDKMNISAEFDVEEKENFYYCTFTGDNLGILIGYRGETLDAIQYLTNLKINRNFEERKRIIIDVEDYRKRREDTLEKLALRLMEKVKKTGRKVVLEPMAPHERRIIHTIVQEDEQVSSFSEGKEPYRRVVIVPKK